MLCCVVGNGDKSKPKNMDMQTRYEAAMVLSGVGDALGYRNGKWEFCRSGIRIHQELAQMGGVENIKVSLPEWRVSDDTVLHLATAEALTIRSSGGDKEILYQHIAAKYKEAMRDMKDRAPGITTTGAVHNLKPGRDKGYLIPFNPRGGGCGAAMRSMCIGLRYPRPDEIDDLVAVSIESGRMTHHHPTGYLGSLASALFVSYSLQGKPLKSWGLGLKLTLPKALEYIQRRGDYVDDNIRAWAYFCGAWDDYLNARKLNDGMSEPFFPPNFEIKDRDEFYKSVSFSGIGGASGHDAPMIAYDALLSSHSWRELCSKSMFHGGDSDSTGVIAASCYGAMFGFAGVPECNYKHVEYRDRLKTVARQLFESARM